MMALNPIDADLRILAGTAKTRNGMMRISTPTERPMASSNYRKHARCAGTLLMAVAFFTSASVLAAEPVGKVSLVKGRASALQQASVTNLYVGAPVYVGARILTGSNARVRLLMVDDTAIILGGNTEFVVSDYRYDAVADAGRASLELVRGFFRAITGRITKRKNASFTLRTASLTLGVRGTDFWGEQHPNLAQIALISGHSIIVSTRAGSVEITSPLYGTRVTSADKPPEPPYRWSDAELARAVGTVD